MKKLIPIIAVLAILAILFKKWSDKNAEKKAAENKPVIERPNEKLKKFTEQSEATEQAGISNAGALGANGFNYKESRQMSVKQLMNGK